MAVEWDILISVGGFAVDVEAEGAIRIVYDQNIQHGDAAVLLNLDGPLDVWVNGVEVIVEWMDVVVDHNDHKGHSIP